MQREQNGLVYFFEQHICIILLCICEQACQTAGDGLQYGCGQISTGEFLYDESSRSASLKYTGGQDGRSAFFNLVIFV